MNDAAPPDLQTVIKDGRWLSHRYDDDSDVILFRFIDRQAHSAATFLTDEEIGDAPMIAAPRVTSLNAARQLNLPAPRYIIHSAYCCSTLLARAFDIPGVSIGIKEPVILNDVVGVHIRGGDPRQVAAALDIATLLLQRPLAAGEATVVKPSNILNPLLPLLLRLRPDARLLLLHAPLEAFVASIARKETVGRNWARDLMWKYMRLGQALRFGFSDEELYKHTDLQVAALGWLAQQALFGEIAQAHPDTVRTLDSETLVTQPKEVMERLAVHFDLPLDAAEVASGPAFQRHSKSGDSFTAAERAAERERSLDIHRAEIDIVVDWIHRVADHAGIQLELPGQLLEPSAGR